MQKYTNQTNLPLSVAVFLASDYYDVQSNAISATALLRPVRQLILAKRVPAEQSLTDLSQMIANRMGAAIHDSIEKAWLTNMEVALKAMGTPAKVIKRIKINPDPKTLQPGDIPVYMEQRATRVLDGIPISGKYDFIFNGAVEDFKSTSTYTWMHETKEDDYILQGSIYRWLNPEIITESYMTINFIFTDWSSMLARQSPKYPTNRIMSKRFNLLSTAETEAYIRSRIDLYRRYGKSPESELPECNDKELWRKNPSWKYYKNPNNRARSTKNFDDKAEAFMRLNEDGNVGLVVEIPGQVVACKYCPAFAICTQKDRLIESGDLILT